VLTTDIGHRLILVVIIVLVWTWPAKPLDASQEGVTKDASQDLPAARGGPSQRGERPTGPIDSSHVIPKGPQWLGAPVMPNGTTLKSEPSELVIAYDLPHDQVRAWYEAALKSYPDARYRDWHEEMYIEDQGASRWHAIKISKTGGPRTTVTIKKDSWTWVIATLVIRFIGVFVVLIVLWICLSIAAFVMLRTMRAASPPPPPETLRDARATPADVDPEMVAAIACALRLSFGPMRADTADPGVPADGTAWAQSGKMKIMEGRSLVFHRRARSD
jgi:hypothetical protein